jgi:GNAT superfamily N-acetyltransferase
MREGLDEPVLLRLTHEALVSMYGCGPRYVARSIPGASMVLSGEHVADLNYLVAASAEADAVEGFRSFVGYADGRELPFCTIVAASVADELSGVCESLGLVHATQWPLMVCPGEAAQALPTEGVTVRAARHGEDVAAMSRVLADAFSMPAESIARALPLSLYDSPGIDTYVAEHEGDVLSSVTITRHGDVVGVWAMGTMAAAQGKGIGRALLSTVMASEREAGAEAFYLGATPAGRPLYERLGYRTVFSAEVWVRGETSQA